MKMRGKVVLTPFCPPTSCLTLLLSCTRALEYFHSCFLHTTHQGIQNGAALLVLMLYILPLASISLLFYSMLHAYMLACCTLASVQYPCSHTHAQAHVVPCRMFVFFFFIYCLSTTSYFATLHSPPNSDK
mmetsp:Transcript_42921/g.110804  ORF Transcript_42921/g.110804 Transcript_42921/m.110804 type:complete len:130 (+) Transcript_42921:1089-1478(+)